MSMTDQDPGMTPPDDAGNLPHFSQEVVGSFLAELSTQNRHAFLNMLVPYRTLPEHDPAVYIIDAHGQDDRDGDKVGIRSPYGLGVVFARGVTMKALGESDGSVLPSTVSEFDPTKKELVDTYLNKAARKSLKKLTRHGETLHPVLDSAVEYFIGHCERVVPDKMLAHNSQDEVRRGAHDYFSVITLLETSGQERKHMKRRLGGAMLMGGLGSMLLTHSFRAKNFWKSSNDQPI